MVNATHEIWGGRAPLRADAPMRKRALMRTGAARLLAACLVAAVPASAASAQQVKRPAKAAKAEDAPKRDTAAIQQAYAAGNKAYEAGDMGGAEQNLSVALSGGGLPNAQMARALYLRGSAYRKQGRPAQAISDLTTAVWLKGGLSDADKAKAMEERQLAYREAGLGDNAPPIGAAPLDQSTKSAAGPKPATGAQVVNVGESNSIWNVFSMPTLPSLSSITGSSPQTAQAPAPASTEQAAIAPAAGFAPAGAEASPAPPTSWDTQTAAAAPSHGSAQIVAGYAPAAQPVAVAEATPAPAASGGGWNPFASTGNFFGNVFGGGSAAPDQQAAAGAAPVTTGSTDHVAWGAETTVTSQTSSMVQRGPEAPPAEPVAQAAPDTLPWNSTSTSVAAAQPAAPVKTAAVARGGNYKLQVAAVRSREEAEKLAQSLNGYPAVRDGIVSTEIDETVIGSMGTFYRVRLGPYANASEPGQLCTTLKPQGFDCLVISQ